LVFRSNCARKVKKRLTLAPYFEVVYSQLSYHCWNFRTPYGGKKPSRNRVVVQAHQSPN
jgi:hypothetical protein